MEITHWWQWLVIHLYDASVLLLVVGSVVLARRHRSLLAGMMAVAFLAHLIGNHAMRGANEDLVEARQVNGSTDRIEATYTGARIVSAAGILVSSICFLAFAWRNQRRPHGDL